MLVSGFRRVGVGGLVYVAPLLLLSVFWRLPEVAPLLVAASFLSALVGFAIWLGGVARVGRGLGELEGLGARVARYGASAVVYSAWFGIALVFGAFLLMPFSSFFAGLTWLASLIPSLLVLSIFVGVVGFFVGFVYGGFVLFLRSENVLFLVSSLLFAVSLAAPMWGVWRVSSLAGVPPQDALSEVVAVLYSFAGGGLAMAAGGFVASFAARSLEGAGGGEGEAPGAETRLYGEGETRVYGAPRGEDGEGARRGEGVYVEVRPVEEERRGEG